jgi:gluconate 2-dehydrogenase alpha chain
MSQPPGVTVEPSADVCILGLGVCGGIIAAELATAGYKVVGIEKGPYWSYESDFSQLKYDEWGVMMLRKFAHPLRQFTYTLRNDSEQLALPVRRYTPYQYIAAGHGVGGMAQHYGGLMGRFGPWVYQMQSETASRYGAGFLDSVDPTNDVLDWPMQYADLDPYYVEFEKAFGVTGTNQGPAQPMSQNFPLPPHPYSNVGSTGFSACEALGYHPYPTPTSLASQPYTNQYGIPANACVYDGWCGEPCNYVCEVGAKANAAYRTIPAATASGNFTMALNSFVFRLDVDPGTKTVTGARYYDASGNVHLQPAKVFYNGIWGLNLVRLMLLSGIGTPYNPSTVTGSLGRGTQYGVPPPKVASVTGILNVGANLYPAGNAEGGAVDILDLADDNFDHTGLNFIGGGMLRLGSYPGGGPKLYDSSAGMLANMDGNSMGSKFKGSLKNFYLPTKTKVTLSMDGPELPDKRWNIDLDPHHTDVYGDPLARWTYNFGANAYNAATYLSGSLDGPAAKILQKMGCTDITVNPGIAPDQFPMDTWPAHIRGGCRLGTDPATSVLNKYGQAWGCQNLFAGGEITDTTGDNTTIGGTHPMGAEVYVQADGIKTYLKSGGPLV